MYDLKYQELLEWVEKILTAEAILTAATFPIYSTKRYVPVAALPMNDNIDFLENIDQGLRITVSWNKHI